MKKNRLLSLLQPKAKPVIITIHGYGRRRSHEMDNLAAWAKDERFTVIQFDLYDLFDEEDCDPKQWLARAEAVVKTHCAGKQPVYLLGFSMGGVIASWLASRYPIKKLALIAPAFTYMDLGKAAGYLKKGTKMIFASSDPDDDDIRVPATFYPAFTEIIRTCRSSIASVFCPVLFLHGDEDEVIPLKSSTWAYAQVPHEQKRLIILHEGRHHLLSEPLTANESYQLLMLFYKDEIVTRKFTLAPDILEVMRRQRQIEKQDRKKAGT